MDVSIVGLGRMGANMARRLSRGGHHIVLYNRTTEKARQLAAEIGADVADELTALLSKLSAPRVVWSMVPAGEATEQMISRLIAVLSPGDTIIDGGNSYYKDSIRRAAMVRDAGLHFVDVGTSGGIWGLSEGYSLMIGGEQETVAHLRPLFETLAPVPDRGWGHVGPVGSGHFVKMVHNGIEYGLMEAFAEGFELLKAKQEFGLDVHQVSEIWRDGSVVRSWLLDLIAAALAKNPDLEGVKGWVDDSGEGRWTVFEAIDQDVPVPIIANSLFARFASRQEEDFAARLLAAMRNEFGGHAVRREE
jgi:6-phosphogluconate dehydrogenase